MSLLTVADAASELGISREAVYKAIREGRLRSVTVLGKIGIEKSAVKAYRPGQLQIRAGRKRAATKRSSKSK